MTCRMARALYTCWTTRLGNTVRIWSWMSSPNSFTVSSRLGSVRRRRGVSGGMRRARARALAADALVAVRGAVAVLAAIDRGARVMRAVRAHEHAAALGEASDAERAEERVEGARGMRE